MLINSSLLSSLSSAKKDSSLLFKYSHIKLPSRLRLHLTRASDSLLGRSLHGLECFHTLVFRCGGLGEVRGDRRFSAYVLPGELLVQGQVELVAAVILVDCHLNVLACLGSDYRWPSCA